MPGRPDSATGRWSAAVNASQKPYTQPRRAHSPPEEVPELYEEEGDEDDEEEDDVSEISNLSSPGAADAASKSGFLSASDAQDLLTAVQAQGNRTAAAAAADAPTLLSMDTFRHRDFKPELLLAALSAPVLQRDPKAVGRAGAAAGGSSSSTMNAATPAGAARLAISHAEALQEVHARAAREALVVWGEVSGQLDVLRTRMTQEQAQAQSYASASAAGAEGAREAVRDLRGRWAKVQALGGRLANRLQAADTLRARAVELSALVGHLAAFAALPDAAASLTSTAGGGVVLDAAEAQEALYASALPSLFWEDKKASEAAATARQLSSMVSQAVSAKQRSKAMLAAQQQHARASGTRGLGPISEAGSEQSAAAAVEAEAARCMSGMGAAGEGTGAGGGRGSAPRPLHLSSSCTPGTLEWCEQRLGGYVRWLEARYVQRLDASSERDDVRGLGHAAAVLSALGKEVMLVQRYVALSPVFQAPIDDYGWLTEPPASAEEGVIRARLVPLVRLLNALQAALEAEVQRSAAALGQLAPGLRKAVMQAFAEKAFNDTLTRALSRFFNEDEQDSAMGFGPSAPGMQWHMRVLAATGSKHPQQQQLSAGRRKRASKGPSLSGSIRGGSADSSSDPSSSSNDDSDDSEEDGGAFDGVHAGLFSAGDEQAAGLLGLLLRLRLLAAAFARTQAMAQAVGLVCGGLVDTASLPSSAFAPFMRRYPAADLTWLHMEATADGVVDNEEDEQTALPLPQITAPSPAKKGQPPPTAPAPPPPLPPRTKPPPALTRSTGQALIRRNAEALARAALLRGSPSAKAAAAVRKLFAGDGPYANDDTPGALLDQMAGYLLGGLEGALAQSQAQDTRPDGRPANCYRLPPPPPPPPPPGQPPLPPPPLPPPVSRAYADQAAKAYVGSRLLPVLQALSAAEGLAGDLQMHYAQEVLPRLAITPLPKGPASTPTSTQTRSRSSMLPTADGHPSLHTQPPPLLLQPSMSARKQYGGSSARHAGAGVVAGTSSSSAQMSGGGAHAQGQGHERAGLPLIPESALAAIGARPAVEDDEDSSHAPLGFSPSLALNGIGKDTITANGGSNSRGPSGRNGGGGGSRVDRSGSAAAAAAALPPEVAAALTSAASQSDLALCVAGLSALLGGVEEAAESVLKRVVTMFAIQAEKCLMVEQRWWELCPPIPDHALVAVVERPTGACLLVCALLKEMRGAAASCISGANLSCFLHDIGCRVHATLCNHMRQYTFNAGGALRWKHDVQTYAAELKSWAGDLQDPASADLSSRMSLLEGLGALMLVEPHTLLHLTDAVLRMDRREALRYISRRADFRYARVDGKSLEQLMLEGGAVA